MTRDRRLATARANGGSIPELGDACEAYFSTHPLPRVREPHATRRRLAAGASLHPLPHTGLSHRSLRHAGTAHSPNARAPERRRSPSFSHRSLPPLAHSAPMGTPGWPLHCRYWWVFEADAVVNAYSRVM